MEKNFQINVPFPETLEGIEELSKAIKDKMVSDWFSEKNKTDFAVEFCYNCGKEQDEKHLSDTAKLAKLLYGQFGSEELRDGYAFKIVLVKS